MKIFLKRAVAVLTVLLITLSVWSDSGIILTKADDGCDETKAAVFRELTADEIVAGMGTGWNLGNTMDGHTGFTPNETLWQNVVTTKELIKSVHDLGFNTVRVPVTWGTKIDDENNYLIDDAWMSRVQDIVDYCISLDMYVIINIHHDGAEQSGWLRVAADNLEPVYEKFEAVWAQIAEHFKNYNEHLIFESMNEITGGDDSIAGQIRDTAVIMELNQIFVDTVRATGSNNAHRWLSVPGRYTNINAETNAEVGFDIPTDTVENRIFVSVHYYDYSFGMLENMGLTEYGPKTASALESDFYKMYEKFTSKGIPVILGEYGCINKNNAVERAYHVEVVNNICKRLGIVAVYWDQGWYDRTMDPDYSFSLVDRNTGETIDKEVTDAIMRGTFIEGDLSSIIKDPALVNFESITTDKESVVMFCNAETSITASGSPSQSNDVLLWSSEDENVATVYNGHIIARGIGVTNIKVRSQSGSVEKSISVTVLASKYDNSCTEITTDNTIYELLTGEYCFLNPKMLPSDADDNFAYTSSNDEVATVSTAGKVLAKSNGTAYVTITASNGITKTVKIIVVSVKRSNEMRLALNVYFNDSNTSYYGNEVGQIITVSGAGEYTLYFDCAEHLSATAVSAGVNALTNLTAVYIKDQDVTEGILGKSAVEACNIVYNKVVVDGVELTINNDTPKSAIKASGILDTNDPVNSWDGSSVNEVTINNHVLNFSTVTNPKRIEVTFTLSNMIFPAEAVDSAVYCDSIAASGKRSVTVEGQPVEISVEVEPKTAGVEVCFVSSDSSVIYVNNGFVSTDDNGIATITLNPLNEGKATVTAMTVNGLSVAFTITQKISTSGEPEPSPSLIPTAVPATPTPTMTPEPTATAEPVITSEATKAPTEILSTPTIAPTDAAEQASSSGITTGTGVVICVIIVAAAAVVIMFVLKRK